MPDSRDRRGLRHNQAFVLMGATLALFHGYTTVQSLHAFYLDSLAWLRKLKRCAGQAISRSYLPEYLAGVDLAALRQLMADFFKSWWPQSGGVAGDRKVFRGSTGDRNAVSDQTGQGFPIEI